MNCIVIPDSNGSFRSRGWSALRRMNEEELMKNGLTLDKTKYMGHTKLLPFRCQIKSFQTRT